MIRRHIILWTVLSLILSACGSSGDETQPTTAKAPIASTAPAHATTRSPTPPPVTEPPEPTPPAEPQRADNQLVPAEAAADEPQPLLATTTTLPPHLQPQVMARHAVNNFYYEINKGKVPAAVKESEPESVAYLSAAIATGAHFGFACEERGYEPGHKTWFACAETIRDNLYVPAGVLLSGQSILSVQDGAVLIESGFAYRPPHGPAWDFLRAFDAWLADGHGIPVLVRDDTGTAMLPHTPYPFSADQASEYMSLAAEFSRRSNDYPPGSANAIAIVDAYYAEVAAGDWDQLREIHGGHSSRNLELAIAFNASFEHDCRAVPPTPSLRSSDIVRVRCQEAMHDDFYEPGGITQRSTLTYAVEGEALTLASGKGCWVREPSGDAPSYIYEFQQWLRSEHGWISGMIEIMAPDTLSMPCSPYPFSTVPDEETVEALNARLADFVATSPNWPKD